MGTLPSHQTADWTREKIRFGEWAPARRLIRAIRSHQHWRMRGIWGRPMRALAGMRARFWGIVCACDIPVGVAMGGGIVFPHPNGIVIHPDVHIGVNCMIFQQVTLGMGGPKPGVPTIGGHVDIGAGARVLGGVIVGHHAKIGANAVVLCDVPEGATAVGIPARIILPRAALAAAGEPAGSTPIQAALSVPGTSPGETGAAITSQAVSAAGRAGEILRP